MGRPNLEDIRIMGVLQRFGIAYFVVATMHILFYRCAAADDVDRPSMFADVRRVWPLWLIMAGICAVHLGVVFGWPVPGCPT